MASTSTNLVIDIGNSRTKYGLFAGSDMLLSGQTDGDPRADLLHLAYNHQVKNIIISSTGTSELELQEAFRDFDLVLLDHHTPLPFQLLYDTPNTLGRDRIGSSSGGATTFSECPLPRS